MLAQHKGIMKGPRMMQGPGMDDSDSESEDGMPPMMHGIPGMPPMSGPSMKPQQPVRQGSSVSGTETESAYSSQTPIGQPPVPGPHGEGYSVVKPEEPSQYDESSRYDDTEVHNYIIGVNSSLIMCYLYN